ncbi:hypothetical protein BCIN_04g02580 [Botrytis cinerea B05.10]|uniref:Uncharacterized protein n=1 Tax=Botryotinia fuckeliana (strain B05.10) TaxID=332648 RepID=A0A384JF22_BOTFB|nr:hypothetical protein BCIN_04g02580 [Botrytis cinerea B05.10]ATZ49061.1 hypothetical protein BCIN_04g02580 [Botrytis cinerea B05.10]
MLEFFGGRRHKAAESPAITPVHSSSSRPRQERRHSNYVENKSSHRPSSSPRSNTWHPSKTRESSPKPQKLKRRNGISNWFFNKPKRVDNEDDEIWCRGVENTDMLGEKGDSSSRGDASRQQAYVNAFNPVPDSVSSQPKAGKVEFRGSTRDSRPTDKQRIPSKRSRSEASLTPRTTPSSVATFANTKPRYTKLSPDSFKNPRSASSVPRHKKTENSGDMSDPEKYWRGRDIRDTRRDLERNMKVQPSDDSVNLSSSDRRDGKRKASRRRDDSCYESDNGPSRNERSDENKKPSRHRNNPDKGSSRNKR